MRAPQLKSDMKALCPPSFEISKLNKCSSKGKCKETASEASKDLDTAQESGGAATVSASCLLI